jgi:hypothetical protein
VHSNASLSWTRYQDVLIVAQRPGLPSDADWAEYLHDISASPFKGVLVIGEDNKLGPTQRAAVVDLLKRNNARNAVVTSSTITRGVMTALGWFGLPVKAFAPTNVDGALEFLAVPLAQRGEALATVEKVKALYTEPRRTAGGAA